jgi:hypothetical protein
MNTASRDPRVDPRPGDRVRVSADEVWTVTGRDGAMVHVLTPEGLRVPRINLWRRATADAVVLAVVDLVTA